jgi:exonuclease III
MPHMPPPALSNPARQGNTTQPETRDVTMNAHQHNPTPRENNINHNLRHNKLKLRANINIATLNMNRLSAPASNMSYLEKWTMINQTLNKYKIAILTIQETHLDKEMTERIRATYEKKMNIITSPNPENPRITARVAFVINKSLITPNKIKAHELCPRRALAIEIDWLESETTRLINIYVPNDRTAHLIFWNGIDKVRQNKGIPKLDFVLGDFNVTEEQIDRAPARLDDPNTIEALRDLRHAWEVYDTWRVAYPNEKLYTYWANTNGGWIKSRLDRIYVTRQAMPMTFDWKMSPSPVPTDHWLVAVKYTPKDAPEIGKGRWTLPIRMLDNAKLIKTIIDRGIRLQHDLEDTQNRWVDRRLTNPQWLWQDFKRDIKAIAKAQIKAMYYKINTHTWLLEKDIKTLANAPNTDTD